MKRHGIFPITLILLGFNAWATPQRLLPEDSRVEFTVEQMGVPVTGEFKRFEAVVDFDAKKPEKSSARLCIETASVSTGNDEADAVARDADWLDQAHSPYATFKSGSIRDLGGGRLEAAGTLTIRNKPRDIVVRFDSTEQTGGKTVLTSEFVIRRSEFGIGGGVWNESGAVSEEVPIKVRLALVQGQSAFRSCQFK